MKKYILLSLVALMCLSVRAQKVWTLKDCIGYALEHNISVKKSENNVRQSEVNLSSAKNKRLPNLDASASQNWSFGRGLTSDNTYTDTNTRSLQLQLGTSVPLFTGFSVPNSIKFEKLNLEAAQYDLEKMRDDIRVQVAQAYVQILYNAELCQVAERQTGIDSMHVDRLREVFANGKASGADVAAAEAALAQSRSMQVQAENDYNMSLLSLTQLLELSSYDNFDVAVPDTAAANFMAIIPNPEDIFTMSLSIRPEIQAGSLRVKASERNEKIAKSGYLPKLSFNAGLGSNAYYTSGFTNKSMGNQLKNNFNQYVGLSLQIPLFDRFVTRNEVRAAKLRTVQAGLDADNVRKNLYKEIQQAHCAAEASRANYMSGRKALTSNCKAFEMISQKYECGKSNITEFNEAKNNYLKAQSDYARAKYEYIYNTTLLKFYAGAELDF